MTPEDYIRSVVQTIDQDDFMFSVIVDDIPYDVYRFTVPKDAYNTQGQLAFCKRGETWEIAVFRPGILSAEEVANEIARSNQ